MRHNTLFPNRTLSSSQPASVANATWHDTLNLRNTSSFLLFGAHQNTEGGLQLPLSGEVETVGDIDTINQLQCKTFVVAGTGQTCFDFRGWSIDFSMVVQASRVADGMLFAVPDKGAPNSDVLHALQVAAMCKIRQIGILFEHGADPAAEMHWRSVLSQAGIQQIDLIPAIEDILPWLATLENNFLPIQPVFGGLVMLAEPDNERVLNVCGAVVEGQIQVDDAIRCMRSGLIATVQHIDVDCERRNMAQVGERVSILLDRPMQAAPMEVITHENGSLTSSDSFAVRLHWLEAGAMTSAMRYMIKVGHQHATALLTRFPVEKSMVGIVPDSSWMHGMVETNIPLIIEVNAPRHFFGGLTLHDAATQRLLAFGAIEENLRQTRHVHHQSLTVNRDRREALKGHRGRVIWFTGLSGSGKSTLANALDTELHAQGYHTYILDGDNIRQGLNKDLGFSDEDRVENIRRIAEVARLMLDAGLIVMTAFISPFRRDRELARALIEPENFVEIYVSTALNVCEQRDVKGLYRKARAGDLPNLSGVGSPYEAPDEPALILDCGKIEVDEAVNAILHHLGAASRCSRTYCRDVEVGIADGPPTRA
ncbi:adenylyl-sulfate kinase [Chitinivorax sp. B]|uniref:adenylyl-sulfate kinase n=1 Tax=Chitinivorax sp. B TaxID=2502235 RepID=UPI0014855429|nr:adenylyl-sulfate kinase [Chitinivorax sp. B]